MTARSFDSLSFDPSFCDCDCRHLMRMLARGGTLIDETNLNVCDCCPRHQIGKTAEALNILVKYPAQKLSSSTSDQTCPCDCRHLMRMLARGGTLIDETNLNVCDCCAHHQVGKTAEELNTLISAPLGYKCECSCRHTMRVLSREGSLLVSEDVNDLMECACCARHQVGKQDAIDETALFPECDEGYNSDNDDVDVCDCGICQIWKGVPIGGV